MNRGGRCTGSYRYPAPFMEKLFTRGDRRRIHYEVLYLAKEESHPEDTYQVGLRKRPAISEQYFDRICFDSDVYGFEEYSEMKISRCSYGKPEINDDGSAIYKGKERGSLAVLKSKFQNKFVSNQVETMKEYVVILKNEARRQYCKEIIIAHPLKNSYEQQVYLDMGFIETNEGLRLEIPE
jgi:hypothetical protein